MAGFQVTKHIDAPPARVFECAADFANAASRITGITRVEMLTDGPVRVGTRFRETRVMFKREATEELEVTAFDPPRSYAIGAVSCGSRFHTEFRFTPKGTGTEVALDFQAEPLTFFAKVMSVLMKPMIKACAKAVGKDLDDLKAAIEADCRQSP